MAENTGRVIPIAIEDEVKTSYMNYAMSVIVSRALPDVRDGLKPVHRRILYGMHDMGLRSDKAPKKSARIVGDVLGKYHPHGDQSVYDALVRMAQDFSLRYPLVQGQGNFGSIDGDPPAAMRYTEARMSKVAEEMLKDLQKETVDFVNNYDDSLTEPSVLPAALPNLLVNGSSGIAVGMATNIPPHNLNEVAQAVEAYIQNPDIEVRDLVEFIKGPDFPTGGLIFGRRHLKRIYEKGKGKIVVRAKIAVETTKSGKDMLIVTEIPYMVNKSNLIVRIADMVRDKRIEGISDVRDESDRQGMRIVIELKRGATPQIILNSLYAHTQLQVTYGINNLALVNGRPQLLSLKDMIVHFVAHRKEIITRRTKFDLRKAKEREHILIGLKIALDNIDEVIRIIRSSQNTPEARERLMTTFELSEIQAQAILDMRLQKLTSLEVRKIIEELEEIRKLISELEALLASEAKILAVVTEETNELSAKYGNPRNTEMLFDEIGDFNDEDLIERENMVVLISSLGYTKRVPVSAYRLQGRGGKGALSSKLREDDLIENVIVANTHDYLLFISSSGKSYWLKSYEIPEGSKTSKGTHIRSLLAISPDEEITAVVKLTEFNQTDSIFLATRSGMVKRVITHDFRNAKRRGITAINIKEHDKVIAAFLCNDSQHILLGSRKGKGLRFKADAVRAMGRAAAGVFGMNLQEGDELTGAVVADDEHQVLIVTENGYGKRIIASDLMPHGRNTGGQRIAVLDQDTGEVVALTRITEEDNIIVMTSVGHSLKVSVESIAQYKPSSRGVRIVTIESPAYVIGIAKAEKDDDDQIPVEELAPESPEQGADQKSESGDEG